MLDTVRRLARESVLIRQAFRNWPIVATAGILWRHLPLPARDLTLVTRKGTRLVVPLGPKAGALYPALEVFAFSAYACDWQLDDKSTIVDVGAHVGSFTLWIAEQHPTQRLLCFEPDPDAFVYLERNVDGLAETFQSAVAARAGTAALARPLPGGSTSSLGRAPDAIPVNIVAFGDVVANAGEVALLKLDCEGSEYDIVLDTPLQAWTRVQRIVLEHHPHPLNSPHELVARLELIGFRLVRERRSGAVGTYWLTR